MIDAGSHQVSLSGGRDRPPDGERHGEQRRAGVSTRGPRGRHEAAGETPYARGGPAGSVAADGPDWIPHPVRHNPVFWHWVFVVLWGVCTFTVFVDPPGRHGRLVTVGLLLVVALAYAALGVPALRTTSAWRAAVYLPLVWGCVIAVEYLDNGAETWVLYFVLFPHTWVLVATRVAVLITMGVLSGVAIARYAQADGSPEEMQRAQRRQVAIEELRTTQAALIASEHERGIQHERDRLSRDIHDTLAQGFTSVITLARAVDAALAREDIETARERLALLEVTATDSLSESRLIIADMTPGHLQSRTLAEAIERLCDGLRQESTVNARLEVRGEPAQLSGTLEVVLLRAAQEALSNVRQHSGASAVSVVLSYEDSQVVILDITDDGTGLDPAVSTSGFGLDGIRARAVEVGGGAIVANNPGRGVRVHVEVPR